MYLGHFVGNALKAIYHSGHFVENTLKAIYHSGYFSKMP
jgi:hypothetical protein